LFPTRARHKCGFNNAGSATAHSVA